MEISETSIRHNRSRQTIGDSNRRMVAQHGKDGTGGGRITAILEKKKQRKNHINDCESDRRPIAV